MIIIIITGQSVGLFQRSLLELFEYIEELKIDNNNNNNNNNRNSVVCVEISFVELYNNYFRNLLNNNNNNNNNNNSVTQSSMSVVSLVSRCC